MSVCNESTADSRHGVVRDGPTGRQHCDGVEEVQNFSIITTASSRYVVVRHGPMGGGHVNKAGEVQSVRNKDGVDSIHVVV